MSERTAENGVEAFAERATEVLLTHRWVCDGCLALATSTSLTDARAGMAALVEATDCRIVQGTCDVCLRAKDVITRAAAR